MADNQTPSEDKNSQIQVKLDTTQEQGQFSNAVSVHVNANEVVIDMGYILPNSKPMTIKVVSRVNMTHQTAESFMNLLSNAMLDWRNRQKEAPKK
jgi:hypothetical protein